MCTTVNGNLKITGIAVILDGHLSMVTDMAVVHLTTLTTLMGATIDKTVSGITPRARGNPGRHHFFLFNISSHWKMVCNLNPQNRTCLVLYVNIANLANHHIIFLLRGLWKKVSEITPLSHPTYSLAKYIVFVIWNKALLTFINVFKLQP